MSNAQIYFFQVLFIILFWSQHTNAQKKNSIEGSLQDSTVTPVAGANIRLVDGIDTLKTISNEKGQFYFKNIKSSKFNIQVRSLGFKVFNAIFDLSSYQDKLFLIPIILHSENKQLKEVSIKAKPQLVLLKKDTIEYNTTAYNIYENDKVEKLLRQLPGIEVDNDGNVTSEGKQVNKLRINGIDFFSGNVKEFINQLPADIFDKIQIIQDYGDEANFTGIKKGESAKMLNLVTKAGMNHGKFGNVSTSIGTNERYGLSFNGNYWQDVKQISVAADLNSVKNVVGVNNTNRIGLTYNDDLNKHLKINNTYNFSSIRTSSQNNSFAETINSFGIINNNINNTSTSQNNVQSFRSNLTYKPNDIEYIKATINLSFNHTNSNFSKNSQQNGIIRQDLMTNSVAVNNIPNGSALLYFGRKLNKKGRIITASIQYNNNSSNNEQQLDNDIKYYYSTGSATKDSLLNRIVTNTNHNRTNSINVTYSEPVNKYSHFDFAYNFNLSQQRTSLITDVSLAPYSLIRIDSLSQSFNSALLTQNIGFDFRYSQNKITLLAGINLQRNTLNEKYESKNLNITNSVNNFSPILNLNYVPSTNNSYELNYSGSSSAPTYDQIQPVEDTRNLQYIVMGNPNLKPSFSHALNFNFRHLGIQSKQVFTVNVGGNVIQHQIISNTSLIKDTLGSFKQLTSYLNVNGAYTLNSNYNWSYPFRILKQSFKISMTGSANYNYGVVYTDDIRSHSISRFYSQGIRTSSYLKKISIDAYVQYQKNITEYSIGQGLSTSIQNWNFTLNSNISIYKNLIFTFESSKRLNQGYGSIGVNNPFVVNASIMQAFFKKNPINLTVQALDLFNQSNRVSQTITGNTVINNRSNIVTRYLLIRLSVPISKFVKPNKQ